MQNSKIKSVAKKAKTLSEIGSDPYFEGKYNFENPVNEIETLACERKNICVNCPMFVEEPISFLKVEDNRIIELSNKICDDCGCTLSYKLRQSKSICSKWQK